MKSMSRNQGNKNMKTEINQPQVGLLKDEKNKPLLEMKANVYERKKRSARLIYFN